MHLCYIDDDEGYSAATTKEKLVVGNDSAKNTPCLAHQVAINRIASRSICICTCSLYIIDGIATSKHILNREYGTQHYRIQEDMKLNC